MRRVVLTGLLVGCVTETGSPEEPDCLDCGVQVGGEPGDVTDTCGPPVVVTAGMGDLVVGGHSGDEAMALLAGPTVYTPGWWDGRVATLTLTGTTDALTVTATDYTEGDPGCFSRIEFDASFHLVSSDGAVDETWTERVYWSAPWNTEDLALQVPIGDLSGSLDTQAIAVGATELIGFLRKGGDVGDLGYLELSSPGPGEGGKEDVRTRFVTWGAIDAPHTGDTGI